MAKSNEYIFFEADQVLTNDHLNETFSYLDQQNRWTRNKLIGIGIVCGFDIVLHPGIIEITKGCGVTSQGYLISQNSTQYTYYLPYAPVAVPTDLPFTHNADLPFYSPFCSGKNINILITDDQFKALEPAKQATASTISSGSTFLKDYDVVLFLELNETDLKNCDMQDCNNKGEKMVFQVRPLLVKITDLPVAASATKGKLTIINQPPQINLKRYNVPYTALTNSDDVLSAFTKLVDNFTLAEVSNAYNYCFEKYGSLLKVSANPFANLLKHLVSYRENILNKAPIHIQYFYDLVDDLIKAYYEFSVKVTAVISTCCPNENLFPLHLVLGSASQASSAFLADSTRTNFIYSPLFSKMGNDAAEAVLLFNRMVIMVNEFAVANTEKIKITPSQYEFPWLSERAIPYYYKLNVSGLELYKYWNYNKTIKGNAAFNLSYNANLYNTSEAVTRPLLYDIEYYNFFRIEGHIGQNYKRALSTILEDRLQYNLPFDVVAVSANLLTIGAILPQCNMLDLETDYKLLISEATCKIHTTFCFISKFPYKTGNHILVNTLPEQEVSVKETAPEIEAIKFSSFKLDAAVNETEFTVMTSAYKKGDFMRKYCPPAKNTIGSSYLAALSSNGVFTNPTTAANTDGTAITKAYAIFFEYIDAVEDLMLILQTQTLATIDLAAFELKYKEYLRYTVAIITYLSLMAERAAAATDIQKRDGADGGYMTFAEGTELNLLVDEMGLLLALCIDERLQVLRNEYTSRLTLYEQQLSFLNYYRKHPGLEHKAGVPKGGTFVLVYYEEGRDALIGNRTIGGVASSPASVTADVQPASTNFDAADIKLIRAFVDECKDAPPATKTTIIGILNREPRPTPRYRIPNGAVIADFYIPYMCCSDCPPVAYILPKERAPRAQVVKPTIGLTGPFCVDDKTEHQITVSASGGTFSDGNGNEVKGIPASGSVFIPAQAGAGTFDIVYTLDGAASDPITVVVQPLPVSNFSVSSTVSTADEIVTITATFTPEDQEGDYTYAWTFDSPFDQTSTEETPTLTTTYDSKADPNGRETSVRLVVSNVCGNGNEVNKKLIINANGVNIPS